MRTNLERLPYKVGSIPYQRAGGMAVPTNDPVVGYVPMWSTGGVLLWVPQSSIDHGSLGGLSDPDHPLYLLKTEFDDVDFLVGTATGHTGAEIVVGTAPGGELGGTWASPTVDATHSGSAHHAQSHGHTDHTDRSRYLYLSAEIAFARDGAPTLAIQGANSLYAAWAMDSASTESSIWQVAPLADYVSGAITVDVHWTNLGAGSGNVVLRAFINPTADGGDYNSTGGLVLGTSHTIAAPAQNIRKVSSLTISYTPVVGTSFTLGIQRLGADGSDTLANDIGLVAVTLSYTADG